MRRIHWPQILGAHLAPGVLAAVVGCGTVPAIGDADPVGVAESWIINGALDTSHQAVVAVLGPESACTGTIVEVRGDSAFVLTAAHCFAGAALDEVRVGDDYLAPTAILPVVDSKVHGQYDPATDLFDFAMIRASGAGAATPVIRALRQSEDIVAKFLPIVHVGYGLTSYPNGTTSQRHRADGLISKVDPLQFGYDQPQSGPCAGDSGGPNLINTNAGERVAGVISYGDEQCAMFGVSGRVSSVVDSFIMPFIDETSSGSSSSSGAGGGASSSSGAGGGAGSPGWVAGSVEDQRPSGDVLTSSCSARPPRRSHRAGWLWALGLAGALRLRGGVGARRRRAR